MSTFMASPKLTDKNTYKMNCFALKTADNMRRERRHILSLPAKICTVNVGNYYHYRRQYVPWTSTDIVVGDSNYMTGYKICRNKHKIVKICLSLWRWHSDCNDHYTNHHYIFTKYHCIFFMCIPSGTLRSSPKRENKTKTKNKNKKYFLCKVETSGFG